ncbi:MAG: chromate transporter [Hydrogenophaga sp.]|jgi:chromate transporter
MNWLQLWEHSTLWWPMFLHFATLSLLAVGGAITTAPDMHRYLVGEQAWLSESQFNASIALSQAAPGPNVLFVALLGWHVGLNAAGGVGDAAWAWPLLGVVVAMSGILLPSTILTFAATRWAHRNRERRGVRAFKAGMAPIVIALLLSTGWVLVSAHSNPAEDWRLWLLTLVVTGVVWRTRVPLLWLIAAGGLAGMLGWV